MDKDEGSRMEKDEGSNMKKDEGSRMENDEGSRMKKERWIELLGIPELSCAPDQATFRRPRKECDVKTTYVSVLQLTGGISIWERKN